MTATMTRRVLALLMVMVAAPAAMWAQAQAGGDAAKPRVVFHGFISGSVFAQDEVFGLGNGSNAEYVAFLGASNDRLILAGDIRNTRLGLTFYGPVTASGLRASAMVDADFFGAFAINNAFGDAQPQLRVRSAYVDLTKGRTTLRIGQSFGAMWAQVPMSQMHAAFPLGMGSAGHIGWREPGIFVTHLIPADGPDDFAIELRANAMAGKWDGPGPMGLNASAGETGVPQIEGRVDFLGGAGRHTWRGYFAAHYDQKDLNGLGRDTAGVGRLVGRAAQLGGRVQRGPLIVAGNAFYGRAIGQIFGQLLQFGDIESVGGWVQTGVLLGDGVSLWAFTGAEDPRDDDVKREVRAPWRLKNGTTAFMARREDGPYALALEFMFSSTRWEQPLVIQRRSGRQIALTATYTF